MSSVDQGTAFGTWADATSRLLYDTVMPVLLTGVDTTGSVADLGGGNGLLRKHIPHAFTVDTDASKQPDVVADVLTYTGKHDLLVVRYVLHYLSDTEVRALFAHLHSYHDGDVLVVQFVNDDLAAKQRNSVNESKHFRTEQQLQGLLAPWCIHDRKRVEYTVCADFYRNRLAHPNPTPHDEAVVGLLLRRCST